MLHPPQEKHTLNLGFNAEGIHGGALVAVRGADFIVFYDWDGRVVRRVDVAAKVGRHGKGWVWMHVSWGTGAG